MDRAGSSTVAAAATSGLVLPTRPRAGIRPARIAFSITNYSAVVVWLNLSNTEGAAVGYGIPLYPGTTLMDSNSEKYECWQGTITCIDATATGTLAVWERVS